MFQLRLKQLPRKHVKDVGSIQSILRLAETMQRRDTEVRVDEEELYYESEKSI